MDTSVVRDGVYRTIRRTGKGRHGCYGQFVANGASDSRSSPSTLTRSTRHALDRETAELPESIAELRVSEENCGGMLTLKIQGDLEVATVLSFRDAAFTAIGRRPQALLLDLRALNQIDISGISSLVTVLRVAQLMKIRFFILPSPSLRSTMEQTGVCRQALLTEGEYDTRTKSAGPPALH